jgi:hypothetical protein
MHQRRWHHFRIVRTAAGHFNFRMIEKALEHRVFLPEYDISNRSHS